VDLRGTDQKRRDHRHRLDPTARPTSAARPIHPPIDRRDDPNAAATWPVSSSPAFETRFRMAKAQPTCRAHAMPTAWRCAPDSGPVVF
jgi:hypothetical protein